MAKKVGHNMSKRILTPVMLLLVMIIVAVLCKSFIFGSVIKIEQVIFNQVEVTPYILKLQGGTSSSALVFSGYEVTTEGDTAFVKLKFALSSFINRSGNFSISKSVSFEHVDKLYITDNTGKTELIWYKRK